MKDQSSIEVQKIPDPEINSKTNHLEIESKDFNTKKINEDNTRFGDWVIKGQTIDF